MKNTWTKCNTENNFCGTGMKGAQAKDEKTGLVWSYPLTGVGGKEFKKNSTTEYSWNNSAKNNAGKTAEELCWQHEGWRLPTQKELMEVYAHDADINLETVGVLRDYWSASMILDTMYACVDLSYGYMSSNDQTALYYIRCVRPAL